MQNALCSTHTRALKATRTHTPVDPVKANQQFPVLPPTPTHISPPLLSAVTYQPATSAARHLLSESVWRPFNPPSKEVFPVNEGRRDPNTKDGGGRGGCDGEIRREGLAQRASQLAPFASVGLQPRHIFSFALCLMTRNAAKRRLHTQKRGRMQLYCEGRIVVV